MGNANIKGDGSEHKYENNKDNKTEGEKHGEGDNDKEEDDENEGKEKIADPSANLNLTPLWIGLGVAGGAIVTVVAAPFVIAGIGFGAGGIVAGSTAASMMSAAGPVAAGSLVATLQSIGAAGMGAASMGAAASAGAAVGGGLTAAGTFIASAFRWNHKAKTDQKSDNTHENLGTNEGNNSNKPHNDDSLETIVNNQCNSHEEHEKMEESFSNENISCLKESIEGKFINVEDLIRSLVKQTSSAVSTSSGNEGEKASSKRRNREQYTVRTKLPSPREGQNIKKNMSKKARDFPDYSDEVENLKRSFAYLGDLKLIMKKQ